MFQRLISFKEINSRLPLFAVFQKMSFLPVSAIPPHALGRDSHRLGGCNDTPQLHLSLALCQATRQSLLGHPFLRCLLFCFFPFLNFFCPVISGPVYIYFVFYMLPHNTSNGEDSQWFEVNKKNRI